jgi:hypothetical protein
MLKEPHHQLDARLIYRAISITEPYKVYSLDSFERLVVFCELIGGTSIFGIRKQKPKLGTEATTKVLDTMNVLNRIDLYVSYSKVQLHLYASRHIVGVDTTINTMLQQHLGEIPDAAAEQRLEPPQNSVLRVNSKFDYNGNVCKVASVNADGTVLTFSLWKPRQGKEIKFDSVEEVLVMVNQKRGLTNIN